jgi:phenylalanine-4-hydroxylase
MDVVVDMLIQEDRKPTYTKVYDGQEFKFYDVAQNNMPKYTEAQHILWQNMMRRQTQLAELNAPIEFLEGLSSFASSHHLLP